LRTGDRLGASETLQLHIVFSSLKKRARILRETRARSVRQCPARGIGLPYAGTEIDFFHTIDYTMPVIEFNPKICFYRRETFILSDAGSGKKRRTKEHG
jgi:hypothetical protein